MSQAVAIIDLDTDLLNSLFPGSILLPEKAGIELPHFETWPPCPDGVYLLHFLKQYKHALHYIGWSPNIEERLAKHRAGTGAGLTRALKEAGIEFVVARVWWGKGHSFERKLHDRKESRSLCPLCSGPRAFNLARG